MANYNYATDSESGIIEASSFEAAIEQLNAMLTEQALANGAWGWVEDVDGYRHEIQG